MASTLVAEPLGEALAPGPRRPLRAPSLGAVVGLGFACWGLLLGLQALHDNSFLTHLATGRLILDEGIPRADPYSFTAPGREWVVQSWLASALYGVIEAWWGSDGLRVLVGGLGAVGAALVWRLTRPAVGLVGRIVVSGLVLGVATGTWSERPLMFGLVLLATVLVAADGGLSPRWLVPVMWLWVNTHGSFPLGLVALAVLALGRRLDGERPGTELAALGWAGLGTLLGGINPLGPELLVFPLELLRRSDVMRLIIEWQAPEFAGAFERLFLLQVVAAVVLLVRRPTFRVALPLAVFLAAALLGSRNVAVASLVLAPGMAAGLRGVGTLVGSRRTPATALAALAMSGAALAVGGSMLNQPGFELAAYPVDAVDWMDDRGLLAGEPRLVTHDYVGNYLEARDGPTGHVFVDDRADMYPDQVIRDYNALLRGRPGWRRILDRYEAGLVLWEREEPLASLVEASDGWRVIYRDDSYLVARRG